MIIADGITPDFGFQCGPTFSTSIVSLRNGREYRNAQWTQPKHRATAQFGSLKQDQFLYLKDLFLSCRGMASAFLFRDWTDFQAKDAKFGVGDGTKTVFQLAKTSSLSGGTPYVRTIRAPDAGAIVKVNEASSSPVISQANGSVTFSSAPANGAILTWSGTYHLVMRFDADDLTATIFNRFADSYALSGTCDLLESFEDAV